MLFLKRDAVEGPQAGPLSMNPTRSLPAATLSLTMLLPKTRLKVAGFCRKQKDSYKHVIGMQHSPNNFTLT